MTIFERGLMLFTGGSAGVLFCIVGSIIAPAFGPFMEWTCVGGVAASLGVCICALIAPSPARKRS